MNKKINVLITGVGGGGVGEQILKCLRMSSLNYNIIGCDMNKNSKGLIDADEAYLLPAATDAGYIDSLLRICKKHDVRVLFHGSEPELTVLSKNRTVFEAENIYIPLNPQSVIDTCMDKNLTMKFLESNGFNVPKYWKIKSEAEISEIDVFPVVFKPSVGGGGSVNTFIAQNEEEAGLFAKYLLKIYSQFLAQEYIGRADEEYTMGVLFNSKGDYVNAIAVKKNIMSGLSNKMKISNRTGRNELGDFLAISSGISQGEIGRFGKITKEGRAIGQRLGCTAALNIQCRVHNGNMYIFEINPRISGTSSLRALIGYNEPDILIRERILGEKIQVDFRYNEGYIARGLCEQFISYDFMNDLKYIS